MNFPPIGESIYSIVRLIHTYYNLNHMHITCYNLNLYIFIGGRGVLGKKMKEKSRKAPMGRGN